jgi:methionine-rich copper-binding protein CopC
MQRFLRMSMRILLTCAAVLLVSALVVAPASAHARLVSSDPSDGAKLSSQPTTVNVTYGEETSLDKSTLQVFYQKDASSAQVQADNGDGHVDVNDRTKASVTLKPGLGAGIYTVKWHTLTEDDNGQADGTFTFTVAGGATDSGSTPATTSGSSGPATTGSTPLPATGTAATWQPAAALLAALILLGGLGLRRVARR